MPFRNNIASSPLVRERLAICRMLIEVITIAHNTHFPGGSITTTSDALLVAAAVFIGHAEGRPMGASKIAAVLQMPHQTVLRKLAVLIENKIIHRRGNVYCMVVSGLHAPKRVAQTRRVARSVLQAADVLSKMDKDT